MLKIRLRRMGSRHRPFYRVVVSDSRRTPTAAALDELGFYDPRRSPSVFKVDLEKVDHWISKGAQPSETLSKLVKKARKGGFADEAPAEEKAEEKAEAAKEEKAEKKEAKAEKKAEAPKEEKAEKKEAKAEKKAEAPKEETAEKKEAKAEAEEKAEAADEAEGEEKKEEA